MTTQVPLIGFICLVIYDFEFLMQEGSFFKADYHIVKKSMTIADIKLLSYLYFLDLVWFVSLHHSQLLIFLSMDNWLAIVCIYSPCLYPRFFHRLCLTGCFLFFMQEVCGFCVHVYCYTCSLEKINERLL